LAAASQPPAATSTLPALIISGSMGVNAKRPMPIATANASRPAAQTAKKEGCRKAAEGFDIGLD